jgi:starch synthase (maltosyl-transferring)
MNHRTQRPLPSGCDGRRRVFIASIKPSVDAGRFAIKRVVGDLFRVDAELVADGHDIVAGYAHHRAPGTEDWTRTPLRARGSDQFCAEFVLDRIGCWEFKVEGYIDAFASAQDGLSRKAASSDVGEIDLTMIADLLSDASTRANGARRADLENHSRTIRDRNLPMADRVQEALSPKVAALACEYPDRKLASQSASLTIVVDPVHARFASWYELFPRSTSHDGTHGTFRTTEDWLPYVRDMGFDVLYLPPIHPIGLSFRKGKNNLPTASPSDIGSPWAIGSTEGGHTSIHPALGTLEDFKHLREQANRHGLKLALDIALQASPDHPWVTEHPGWFRQRPDGSIQYAENPPKKYQDIYPFDFECDDWQSLWIALRGIFLFWIDQGITIFRVDNPHTKPLMFWEWCISSIKHTHPEVTFLSEAFTRPSLKYALAKIGFSQSYTYFTWRHTKHEITDYLRALTEGEVPDFFRPSLWPNTPDILPDDLQYGGRPAFVARLVLAGTLSSHYGIYGPAFELLEHAARPNSGEYADNEKYEIKNWDLGRPDSIRPIVKLLNRIRLDHPALQRNDTLRFHSTDNDYLICYSKSWADDVLLIAVNLDFHHRQAGWVELDLETLGLTNRNESFQMHDLLGGGRYLWQGPRNYIEIDPHSMPAQIFLVKRKRRTERDFDYFA